jgi:hypothetical protein
MQRRYILPLLLAACSSPRLPNPNGAAHDQTGWAVAIDGTWAIASAPRNDSLSPNAGKALIYHRSGGSWPLHTTIASESPVTNADFGWAVDISGERVIVGAFGDVTNNFITGAAYVFERAGDVWSQAARLVVDTIGESGFGTSVAISGDYAVVGAPYPPPPTFAGPGVAWVYHRNPGNGQWNLDALLEAGDAIDFIEFGSSVSIDGDVIVVGAKKGVAANTVAGAAYVFRRQGSNWNEEAKLVASDPAYHDFFGSAVSVSGDRIVVGAREDDATGDAAGAAYVFVRNATSGVWSETQKLTAEDGSEGDNFGYAVSIDGARILIGAWLADGSSNTTGAAYQFRIAGNSWEQARKLVHGNGAYGDGYGASVSISGDCGIVGAVNQDSGDLANVGAAYVYCNLPGQIPPRFELDIICCVEVPDPLGPVVVTTRIANTGDSRLLGRRWIEAVDPGGNTQVVVGAEAFTMAEGEERSERHVFRLPALTPGVPYVLRLRWQDASGIRTVYAETALRR